MKEGADRGEITQEGRGVKGNTLCEDLGDS